MTARIVIHADAEALATAAAGRWLEIGREAIAERSRYHVALAGGETPRRLYETLARPGHAERIDWSAVHVFFGDERCVPPDHPDSNYRMARTALLDRVPIPEAQVHRIDGAASDPAEAAWAYDRRLRRTLPLGPGDVPTFDLVLLGLGEDGHIASLFPGTDLLEERARCAAAVHVDARVGWRISITLPVINQAHRVLALAAGRRKADIIRRVLAAPPPTPPYPAQRLAPRAGVEWHLDEAAASALPGEVRA